MGILKSIVNSAVNEGVRKGVSRGVSNAIGKAFEQALAPTAEKLANKSAEAINSASEQLDKGINDAATEVKTSATEVKAEASQAAASVGGLAGLESALAGLASRAEKYATQMSASMKICPSCGKPSPADKDFCPYCGTKLPETTLGQDYTCPKCGEVNTIGTKYCTKCGALLPAAEAEVKAKQAKDEKALEKMAELLPQYPKWTVGGSEFDIDENGDNNGYPIYTLSLVGGRKELDAYIALLKEAGFNDAGDDYWKTIDGVCRTVNVTDAINGDCLNVGFYVSDRDKKVEAKPKPAEDPLADLKGAAKGLFKKFLG